MAEPAPAFNCSAELAGIAKGSPIRFEYDRTRLIAPYDATLPTYINLFADPRCAELKIEVDGHADDIGDESYNQFLSDLRAEHVQKVLSRAGILRNRLSAIGFSETRPIDPARTEEARARNRRVEFKFYE